VLLIVPTRKKSLKTATINLTKQKILLGRFNQKKNTPNLASLFIAHFHLSILPASDKFWHLQ